MGELVVDDLVAGPLTARDVFGGDRSALIAALEVALIEANVTAAEADAGLEVEPGVDGGEGADGLARRSRAVMAQAAKAIDDLLGQLVLDDLLLGGWMQLAELRGAMDETAADGGSAHIALKEHTVSSHHEPSLDLVVNGVNKTLMRLEIDLRLEVSTGELVVESGRVAGATLGSLTAAGTVATAGQVMVERQSGRLDLSRLRPAVPATTA